MKSFISLTKTLILALVIGLGVSYAFATAGWTDPTEAPPGGNTAAPINVGEIDQIKNAGLSLNKLTVFGQVLIQDGTQGEGRVLTSSATGVASWAATSTLGFGGGGETSSQSALIDSVAKALNGEQAVTTSFPSETKFVTIRATVFEPVNNGNGRLGTIDIVADMTLRTYSAISVFESAADSPDPTVAVNDVAFNTNTRVVIGAGTDYVNFKVNESSGTLTFTPGKLPGSALFEFFR